MLCVFLICACSWSDRPKRLIFGDPYGINSYTETSDCSIGPSSLNCPVSISDKIVSYTVFFFILIFFYFKFWLVTSADKRAKYLKTTRCSHTGSVVFHKHSDVIWRLLPPEGSAPRQVTVWDQQRHISPYRETQELRAFTTSVLSFNNGSYILGEEECSVNCHLVSKCTK